MPLNAHLLVKLNNYKAQADKIRMLPIQKNGLKIKICYSY